MARPSARLIPKNSIAGTPSRPSYLPSDSMLAIVKFRLSAQAMVASGR